MYAKIKPVSYRTGQAKCLVVRNISVQLNDRAIVDWSLMGDQVTDRREYESGGCQMSGEEYTAWGSDDSYVYTWLASKLNLTVMSLEDGNYWHMALIQPPGASIAPPVQSSTVTEQIVNQSIGSSTT